MDVCIVLCVVVGVNSRVVMCVFMCDCIRDYVCLYV